MSHAHPIPLWPVSLLSKQEHPLDETTEDGEPFWGGDRRVPTPVTFDPANRLHMDFLVSATLLKSRAFNVHSAGKSGPEIESMVASVLSELLPDYKVRRKRDGVGLCPGGVAVGKGREED